MPSNSYTVKSTSRLTSKVEDIELSVTPVGLARKVLRTEIIENPKNPRNSVKLCLVHQRRRQPTDEWEDLPGPGLTATNPAAPSKFPLDSAETFALYARLADLFRLGQGGVRPGTVVLQIANEDEIIRTDAPRARLVKRLLDSNYGEEIWRMLVDLEPDLASKLAAALIYQQREHVLREFERSISRDLDETYWNNLLKANHWIFGGGNVDVISERRLDIGNTTDIPLRVHGGFMDVVELKRPKFPFWMQDRRGQAYRYRTKHLLPHPELSGAIAQTQRYILQAEKHVADSDFQRSHGVVPLKPRGLVVHGRSHDWEQTEWEAFRLLNDNLHGIQVLTFDHLLVQAKRMLQSD